MNDLINKLSAYNIFNYLLPGIIFVALASKLTKYSLIQQDILIGIFLYYFIGLVISRFGSLIIEPILRRFKFLKFADYEDFIKASKKDEKIELLSEQNNMYRTICSTFILLLLLKIYEIIETQYQVLQNWNSIILIVLLLVMFLLSYRKQTKYVKKRIDANP